VGEKKESGGMEKETEKEKEIERERERERERPKVGEKKEQQVNEI
jgi:hypothetical protein